MDMRQINGSTPWYPAECFYAFRSIIQCYLSRWVVSTMFGLLMTWSVLLSYLIRRCPPSLPRGIIISRGRPRAYLLHQWGTYRSVMQNDYSYPSQRSKWQYYVNSFPERLNRYRLLTTMVIRPFEFSGIIRCGWTRHAKRTSFLRALLAVFVSHGNSKTRSYLRVSLIVETTSSKPFLLCLPEEHKEKEREHSFKWNCLTAWWQVLKWLSLRRSVRLLPCSPNNKPLYFE